MDSMDNVLISRERYDEFLKLETRVSVVVERVAHDKYIAINDLLRILGTEEAIDVALEVEKKEREKQKALEEKYTSMRGD